MNALPKTVKEHRNNPFSQIKRNLETKETIFFFTKKISRKNIQTQPMLMLKRNLTNCNTNQKLGESCSLQAPVWLQLKLQEQSWKWQWLVFHLKAEVKVSSAIRPHLLLDSSVLKALQAKALAHVTEHSRISPQLAEGEQTVGQCCARKLQKKFHEFLGRQIVSLTLLELILKNHLRWPIWAVFETGN